MAFSFSGIHPDDIAVARQASADYAGSNAILRRLKSFNITQSVEEYKKILQENPQGDILNRLVDDLENKDPAIALTAALVLVEQRFITEEERLKAVKVIKDNFEKFFDKPLEYKNMVDLHIHSFYSDAVGTSSEMVFGAWKQGMKAISIVNHNTFDGVYEALLAGEILGVKVIPAIELDLMDESLGIKNMHVLAYFDKGGSAGFKKWLEEIFKDPDKKKIDELYQIFVDNGRNMIDAFNEKKFLAQDEEEILVLEEDDIVGRVGEMINRARLAEALLDKYGADKLGESNITAIMKKYFTVAQGTYFGRHSLPMEDVFKFVVRNGGVLILPHPTEVTAEYGYEVLYNLLNKYAAIEIDGKKYLGFRGVEVYSAKTPAEKRQEYFDIIKRLSQNNPVYQEYPLIVTSGSDGHFHFNDFASQKIPFIQPENALSLSDLLYQLQHTKDIADRIINI